MQVTALSFKTSINNFFLLHKVACVADEGQVTFCYSVSWFELFKKKASAFSRHPRNSVILSFANRNIFSLYLRKFERKKKKSSNLILFFVQFLSAFRACDCVQKKRIVNWRFWNVNWCFETQCGYLHPMPLHLIGLESLRWTSFKHALQTVAKVLHCSLHGNFHCNIIEEKTRSALQFVVVVAAAACCCCCYLYIKLPTFANF